MDSDVKDGIISPGLANDLKCMMNRKYELVQHVWTLEIDSLKLDMKELS